VGPCEEARPLEPWQPVWRGLTRLALRIGRVALLWAWYSGLVAYASVSLGMTTHGPLLALVAGALVAEALGVFGGLVLLARVVRP
jgi:hypothetical protein